MKIIAKLTKAALVGAVGYGLYKGIRKARDEKVGKQIRDWYTRLKKEKGTHV